VVNINELILNKRFGKLKVWCFKCPTFHIAIRYGQGEERAAIEKLHFTNDKI